MKNGILYAILIMVTVILIIGLALEVGYLKNCKNVQAATIARQELVIDSLRNPVDTTEFLVEHSELKGD